MSTLNLLSVADFPLLAIGQFVYRRTSSSPMIGPVSMHLAADLARRLNRDGMPAPVLASESFIFTVDADQPTPKEPE